MSGEMIEPRPIPAPAAERGQMNKDSLKVRVERLEHRVADLGAFVQAAVKEMRQQETSLLGLLCLKCGEPVVYDFYCEPHLPPKIRVIYIKEMTAKWARRKEKSK